MKKLFLFNVSMFMLFFAHSQTLVFEEDFETLPLGVTTSGNPLWSINTTFSNTGSQSYHNDISIGDTSYVTTQSFSTLGNSFVIFEFSHICKIDVFDVGLIEVSIDNGLSWTRLTSSEYLGSGQFGTLGNRFAAASYPTLWQASSPTAMPTNSWWVTEVFDLSSLASNEANVQIRFVLLDGGNPPGSNNNYGWLIDDIKVTASDSELIPPDVSMNTPIVQDTVYGTGPFFISANITDASGVHSAYIVYTINSVTDSIPMLNVSGDTYEAEIPSLPLYTHVDYYVLGIDSAPASNQGTSLNYWFYNTKLPAEIIIGQGTQVPNFTLYSPIYGYSSTNTTRHSASNILFTQQDLSAAGIIPGSLITSLSFYKAGTGGTHSSSPVNMSIYMANTSNVSPLSLSTTLNDIYSTHTLVYSSTNHEIPSVSGWHDIIIDNPFIYLGGALEIATHNEITGTSPYLTGKLDWVYTSGYSDYVVARVSSSTISPTDPFNATTTQYKHRPNVKFGFFTTTDPNDAGVVQIPSPSGTVITVAPQPVYAVIKNYGTNILTSVDVSFSVNNGPAVTTTWTGNLHEDMVSEHILVGNGHFINGPNTLKVWTSSPNGATDDNPINDTLTIHLFGCEAILDGHYSIGGAGADFNTIDDALVAIANCGISGPVVFNIAPGIYQGQIVIPNIQSATATNTITFRGTHGTILRHTPGNSNERALFYIDGAKHFRFDSLEVELNPAATSGWGFYIGDNSENIHITNCKISVNDNSTSMNYSGIVVSGSPTGATSASSNIKDIHISNNIIQGGYYGLTLVGSTASKLKGATVTNNSFLDNHLHAIYINNNESPQVIGNYIDIRSTGSTVTNSGSGIYNLNTDGSFNYSSNTIKNVGQYGIYISGSNASTSEPSLISNNAIGGGFRNTLSSTSGIYISTSSNIDIFYNSINMDGVSGRGLNALNSAAGLRIKNNSFVFSGLGNGYASFISSTASVLAHDYNNYERGTSSLFVYYGAGRSSLTALRNVNIPPGNDQNSVSGDPIYISATNLYPLGPVLNDVGTPIPGIVTDINGITRDAVNPDIGAYEFTPVTADIALIDGYIINSLCLNTNDSLYLTIENIIGPAVDFSVHPLTIEWTVSGPVNSNGTIVLNTGNLSPGAVMQIGGDGVDMSEPGTYSLSAYLEPNMANMLQINDTITDAYSLFVEGPIFYAIPDSVFITNSIDTVQLSVQSNMFPYGSNFSWSLNGMITSHGNTDTVVGPFNVDGLYQYVASLTTPCGILTDTVNIHVLIPPYDLALTELVAPTTGDCADVDNTLIIRVANLGTDTLFGGFDASYSIAHGLPVTENVTDPVPPGQSIIYSFSTPFNLNMTGGDTTFQITTYVNAPADSIQHNDTLNRVLTMHYTPPIPQGVNDTVLYGTSATLQASSAYQLNWYSSPTSQIVLDTGATFTTPPMYINTPFYVAAEVGIGTSLSVGPADNTIGSGVYEMDDQYYLAFDVINPLGVNISTVDVYFQNQPSQPPGPPFTIVVIDNNNQVVASYSDYAVIMGGPPQVVPVDFFVPQGKDYIMKFSVAASAFCNTTGSDFPYEVPGMIAITKHNYSFKGSYPYFYNWGLGESVGCESQRTEVWAVVTGNPPVDAGAVSIDAPVSPTDLQPQNTMVSIQNFGTDPLTSVTINWTVNGQVQTSHNWSGNLAFGDVESVAIGSFTPDIGNNEIVAWTSQPNGIADPMPYNDTTYATVLSYVPLNGVYTIGGTNPDFYTFNEAVDAMLNWTIDGPVTFIVRPGTYNERVVIPSIVGASAVNTITFEGEPGAIIDFEPTVSSERAVIAITGGQHIRIENLTIDIPQSADFGWGIYIGNNSSDILVKNCVIETDILSSSQNYSGIVVSGSATSATSTTNNVDSIRLEENTITGGYYGIVVIGSNTLKMDGVRIIGNNINETYMHGVYMNHLQTPVANNNSIDMRSAMGFSTTSGSGIYCINAGGPFDISKNKITNPGQYGIYIASSDATSQTPSTITNNAIGEGFRNNSGIGMHLTSSSHIAVYYNSISCDANSGRAMTVHASASDVRIMNCSFVFAGLSNGYTLYVESPASISELDHNNYYKGGSAFFVYYGAHRTNLTALQAVNVPTGNDLNSVSGDPIHLSNVNLFPAGIILNEAATPIPGITTDILGTTRDAVTPDIGAYEYTPASIDAAVSSIDNIDPLITGGTSIAPEITITNWGTNTLTAVPVKYSVNGGAPITETWIGSLAPFSSVTFNFFTPFVVPNGTFTICAYTDVPGDINNNNDTSCLTVFGIPYYTIPFSDDFEGVPQFYTMGTNNQWEMGVPSASIINSAHSPVNVWATNLSGNYNNNSNYNLFSPIFSFSNVHNAILSFWHWYETEADVDGGKIQFSTDNGQSWQNLGTVGDPAGNNWYNTANINGSPAFSGSSGGWVHSTYDLTQFSNYPFPIQFRFNFYSNDVNTDNGWAIDDFEIYQLQIPIDAGVVEILNPPASYPIGTPQTVEVTIKNFGTDTLTNIPVRYRINNGVPVQEQWTGVLLPGDSAFHSFSTPINESASYSLCAFTRVTGDTYLNNDTTCLNVTLTPAEYDAGVVEIVQPSQPTQPGDAINVSAKIRNFGTQTLTSIDIAFDINAGGQTVETWTGTLNPGQEIVYDFTAPYISPSGNHILCVETKLSNDQNSNNDRICKTINIVGMESLEHEGISLEQNNPNPTNEYAIIGFYIPTAGETIFRVTNILGQNILETHKNRPAGKHEIILNTNGLNAGVYYYSLEFNGKRLTRKMIVH